MSWQALSFVLLIHAVALISPGPDFAVVTRLSIVGGRRTGLWVAAGVAAAIGVYVLVCVLGLALVLAALPGLARLLSIAGALYLAWLGWKLLRAPDALGDAASAVQPRGGFFIQGFLVLMANPKALLWFGAFIPQFVDPQGNYVAQIVLLGLTAMAVAGVSDGAYAVLTGRAGALLSRRRVRLVSRVSGGFLIGGGLWLALSRAR
jgi:threonine/homoserine/homoserine lactone efflux protein